MKATGIVRRIDDLGRVVVPKEIRRTLRIREGDPLEIFTDREGEIILKKYSPIGELSQFAGQYAESLAQTTGHLVCITDRDHVVAAAGSGKKDFDGKPISKQLEEVIEERKNQVSEKGDDRFIKVTLDDSGEHYSQAISTIICEGDAIGSVVLYSKDEKNKIGDTESKLAVTAAGFLGRQMEQ
ncbi:MAG: stage V sporulation protein T [Lachnospiraceae bacterium]|nr:stage V sporulation protein T [Lachnospiraceae bacterium]